MTAGSTELHIPSELIRLRKLLRKASLWQQQIDAGDTDVDDGKLQVLKDRTMLKQQLRCHPAELH